MEVKDYCARKLYSGFPVLTQEQLDECNSLFPAYLFISKHKDGLHLYTSCCHVHNYVIEEQRTLPGKVAACAGLRHNEETQCPFCGKNATVKWLSKAGKRKSLSAYRHVVFLSAEQDTPLYAQAFVARKTYTDFLDIFGYPTYSFYSAYVFQPGRPKRIWFDWYSEKRREEECVRTEEPFLKPYLASYGREDYHVIGIEAIGRSCMKYSQYEAYAKDAVENDNHWEMMRYLSTYCLQPKIEMWQKLGLRQAVYDLVIRQVKNAAAIDWSEQDPKKALGLSKPDLKFFLSFRNRSLDDVACFKRLRRHGQRVDFQWLCKVELPGHDKIWLVRWALGNKQKFHKVVNYLEKYTGPRCYGGWFGIEHALQFWKDYMEMAARLHYDLTEEVVLFPKNLFEAHNTADEILHAEQRRKEAEKQKRDNEAYQERLRKLDERYSFQLAGYHIRPPMTIQEIVDEGQALKHCVGGYAARHAEGKVVILFLRDDAMPNKPLVTIEMNGSHLKQIHGYRNEQDGAPDPMKVYADIVVPWLDWVTAGSKRNKEGTPVLPNNKKEDKTA